MTRKKKCMITVISISGAIIFAISAIFATAAIMGKPLTVNPSRELNGVDKDLQDALWYSSVAANSHNSQMWSIKLYLNESRLQVAIDESRVLNVVDPDKREAYISLGCYIETMRVAFDAYGYDTQLTFSGLSVNVKYSKRQNSTVNTYKIALIEKRHTDKSVYSNTKIKEETKKKLSDKNPAIFIYQNGEENFAYLKQISMDAVTLQSANQEYRDELAAWMRFSDKEAEEKLDGITAEMIGLKGIVKTFYYWTTTRESAKGDKFAKQGIDTAKKQLNNCGALAIITGGDTFEELINVGRQTQSFWFDCVENNISAQPLSAALETAPFCLSIQDDLKLSLPVQMIVRMGYVDEYGKNNGLRRNLADYIEVV